MTDKLKEVNKTLFSSKWNSKKKGCKEHKRAQETCDTVDSSAICDTGVPEERRKLMEKFSNK